MQRSILHVDMNCFYASVEQHTNPELRGKPIAVAGDPERRNGIILTKSREAKRAGVKTAEPIWQARQKCPDLIVVPPRYSTYMRYSKLARHIYYQYTDQVEPFGLDESWLDITGSLNLFGGSAYLVAQEISERIKAELGLTVSVGLSWNKIFAKFGSDIDEGDGIVVITPANYQSIVWPCPTRDLLYVGRATAAKLHSSCIDTIGQIATASNYLLAKRLGKMGGILKTFARGEDVTPVKVMNANKLDVDYAIKSIGNGLTAPHDLCDEQSAKALIYLLAESVAQRLRELKLKATTVAIGVKKPSLGGYTRQMPLDVPSCSTREIAHAAFSMLRANEPLTSENPVRALGVRACNLVSATAPVQVDLFDDVEKRIQQENLDNAIDNLRRRFGNKSVYYACERYDDALLDCDIKATNTVHPVGFFCESGVV